MKPPLMNMGDVHSDASGESKQTVRVYEVKEGKMRTIKEMAPLGQAINPDLPQVEHEGLKRVYKAAETAHQPENEFVKNL